MSVQQISSIVRQILAVAAVVMGALTQALQGIHLPTAVSAVLAAGGVLLLNIEHYLGDPSTGANPAVDASSIAVDASTVALQQAQAAEIHAQTPVGNAGAPPSVVVSATPPQPVPSAAVAVPTPTVAAPVLPPTAPAS